MTSNIRINKICEQCGRLFEARKITSRTCSDTCAKKAYKARQKAEKIEGSKKEFIMVKANDRVNENEFLTVRDMAKLLHCSVRTAYYLITKGKIKAVNLSQRKTLIKRSEIDNLFA